MNSEKYSYIKNLDTDTYLLENKKNKENQVLKLLVKRDEYPGNFEMFKRRFNDINNIPNTKIIMPEKINYINKQFYKMTDFQQVSLNEIINEKVLSVKEAILIFEDLLETVNQFHINKQIHGNLKPSNIFISKNGKVYISDFMFEKALKETIYIIPDTDNTLIYHRDIYALGLIFFELLNWANAVQGEPEKKIYIPGNFYSLIEKCCYGYKTCGFNNAGDVLSYLNKAKSVSIDNIKPKELEDTKIETLQRKNKFRKKTKVILVYIAMYVLIGIIALYLYLKNV